MQCFHLANAFETVFETRFEISFVVAKQPTSACPTSWKKTSTRRRSRIPCVVVEKLRRVDVKVYRHCRLKNEESQQTFNKNSCHLLTAITHPVMRYAKQINNLTGKQNYESKTVDVSMM